MRKVDDGEKQTGKKGEKERLMRIVATTSLPAVDRRNADCCNVARLFQFQAYLHYVSRCVHKMLADMLTQNC